MLPGRTPDEVKALQEAEASSKKDLPFDPDELQGKATTQDKPSFDDQLNRIQQDAIKQGAPPELFAKDTDKVRFVPAGTALEIRGHKYELDQLTAQGADVATDARDTAQSKPYNLDRLRVPTVVSGDGVKRIDGQFLPDDNNLIDAVGKVTEPITNAVSKFTADSSKQLGDLLESGKRAVGMSPQAEEHKPMHQATGDGSTLPKPIQNPGDAANLGIGAGVGFVKGVNEMMPGFTPKGVIDGTVQAAKQLGELAKAHGAHEKNLHENPLPTLFNDAVAAKKMYDGAVEWANKRSQTESFAERGQDIGKASPDVLMASEIIFIAKCKLVPPREATKLQLETKTPQELEALGIKRTSADQIKPEDMVNPIDRNAAPPEKVRQLQQLSAENKPLVEDFAKHIDEKFGTTSSEPHLKDPTDILLKSVRAEIKEKSPWFEIEHVRDSLRFKTPVDDLSVLPAIVKELKESHFQIIKADVDKLVNPKGRGWRMASFDLRAPNGQIIEYQILATEMNEAGKMEHSTYKSLREKDVNKMTQAEMDGKREAELQATALYRRAHEAYLRRTGQTEGSLKQFITDTRKTLSE